MVQPFRQFHQSGLLTGPLFLVLLDRSKLPQDGLFLLRNRLELVSQFRVVHIFQHLIQQLLLLGSQRIQPVAEGQRVDAIRIPALLDAAGEIQQLVPKALSCSTYKNRSRTACSMHSIKHNRLEAAVLFAIQYQVNTAVSYSELIARINSAPLKKSQSHRLNDQIAAKEKELTRITRYKQSLYQDWKDGEITQQEYRDMKADYERQAAELADVLARLNAERAELANGVDKEHPALVAFAKYQSIETLTREILTDLVDHIKVYENGNISVHFKFADEFRKIAEYIEINTTDTAEAG